MRKLFFLFFISTAIMAQTFGSYPAVTNIAPTDLYILRQGTPPSTATKKVTWAQWRLALDTAYVRRLTKQSLTNKFAFYDSVSTFGNLFGYGGVDLFNASYLVIPATLGNGEGSIAYENDKITYRNIGGDPDTLHSVFKRNKFYSGSDYLSTSKLLLDGAVKITGRDTAKADYIYSKNGHLWWRKNDSTAVSLDSVIVGIQGDTVRFAVNLMGGANKKIPYQFAPDSTVFLDAPTDTNYVLTGAFKWKANASAVDSSVFATKYFASQTYEPKFTTLGISKGGTNTNWFTTGKFIKYNGTKLISTTYDSTSFPLTNGTGASGTWGISITGNAGTVTNGIYTSSTWSGGDLAGTGLAATVNNDSHDHTGSTISGLSTADFTSTNVSNWYNDAGYTTLALARAGLSSTATGLTYTSATGVFSLTSGYVIPTTTQETNWNSAYSHSTSAHQTIINGTGFVKASGTTLSYDNSTYLTAEVDGSTTNEIQTLGTSGNTITLTSGGSVTAPYATTAGSVAWSNVTSKPTVFTADPALQYNWTNYQQWSSASTTNATLGSFILSGNLSGATLKGVSSVVSYTGSPTAQNSYGGYFSATGNNSGGSNAYGIYATATGATNNYAGYFDGNVYVNGNITGTLIGNATTVTNGIYTNTTNTFTGSNIIGTNGSLDINLGWFKLSKNNYPGGGVAGILYANNTMDRVYYTKSGGTVDSLAFKSELHSPITETITGITLTGQELSLTSGYVIPTTTQETNWNTAYTNTHTHANKAKLDSITVAASRINAIPSSYQTIINGTGFVKASGTTLSYDNSTYLTGNQMITLSGGVTGSGTTSITTTVTNDSHNHTASTISGLGVSDFTSADISQWTNDASYTTLATVLGNANTWTNTNTFNTGILFGGVGYLSLPNKPQTTTGYLWYRDSRVRYYNGTSALALVDSSDLLLYGKLASANSWTNSQTFNGSGGKTVSFAAGHYFQLPGFMGSTAGQIRFDGTGDYVSYNNASGVETRIAKYSEIPSLTNYVTTNTTQTITGYKTLNAGLAVGKSGPSAGIDGQIDFLNATNTNTTSLLKPADNGEYDIYLPNGAGTLALNNQTMYIGTTSVAINRSSGALSLTGVSIDGNAGTATTAATATSAATSTYLKDKTTTGRIQISGITAEMDRTYTMPDADETFPAHGSSGNLMVSNGTIWTSIAPPTWNQNTTGNASTVTNGVYTNTTQTLTGYKTLNAGLAVGKSGPAGIDGQIDFLNDANTNTTSLFGPTDNGEYDIYLPGGGGTLALTSQLANYAIAPASNNDDYIPLWDGANSKTLKNGLPYTAAATASTVVTRDGNAKSAFRTIEVGSVPNVYGEILLYGSTGKYTSITTSAASTDRLVFFPNLGGTLIIDGGSYSNPSWITGLAWSKISSTPTTLSGYGIADAVTTNTTQTITGTKTIRNPLYLGDFSTTTEGELIFNNGTNNLTTKITAPNTSGSGKTITAPNLSGTIALTDVAQTISGDITFTGANSFGNDKPTTFASATILTPTNVTVSANTIDASATGTSSATVWKWTATGSSATLSTLSNPTSGQIITIYVTDGTYNLTINEIGNIVTPGSSIVLNTFDSATFVYDTGTNKWICTAYVDN